MIIKTNPDEIENYLIDASNIKGFCDAVYFPKTARDVSEILSEANEKNTPVTISGNGTGLTGARVPKGGIVIATDKLNKILEINVEGKYAIVEPGVLLSDFQEAVRQKGFLYPPDPTERNCYIGGTISTNASGEKTFKYGPTRNYVLELEIILANGEKLVLARGREKAAGNELLLTTEEGGNYKIILPEYKMPATKNASGYYSRKNMDAIDLFIGSEGTLGVVTKAKLKLEEFPENIISCMVFFNSENDAMAFISEARTISYLNREKHNAGNLDALALEFFDTHSLNFMKDDYSSIPAEAKSAVWFEQESNATDETSLIEKWIELIEKHNGDEESAWFASSDKERKELQKFRHAISEKVVDYVSKNNLKKLGTDVAVPDEKFNKLYNYSKDIAEKSGLFYVAYGHFGNSHIHLNILHKGGKEYETGKEIYTAICKKAIELGGTVSAEHGIGKLKREYLLMMYGKETIEKMKQLKLTLDKNYILGQGNLFNM